MSARRVCVSLFAVWLFGSPPSSAHALCIDDGKFYAKTTVEQEFRDASVVVRGNVLSSQEISIGDPDESLGVLYHVRIDHSFKGKPPQNLIYYSRRDSGGFYLNVGTQYLLFLNPISSSMWAKDAPGAMVVNYNCGQSRAWAEVPLGDRKRLSALSVGDNARAYSPPK